MTTEHGAGRSGHNFELEEAAQQLLLGWLPASLKTCIDRLLAHGQTPAQILAVVRATSRVAPGGERQRTFVPLAVEAYLKRKQEGETHE